MRWLDNKCYQIAKKKVTEAPTLLPSIRNPGPIFLPTENAPKYTFPNHFPGKPHKVPLHTVI